MKRKIAGLLAALVVCQGASGCSSMLTRDYTSVTPHSATPVADGDASALRVGSYQELVNALIYLIDRRAESGAIRLEGDEETDIKSQLDEACLEVVQEDPMGAYAVEYIKYSLTPVVGSYEADVEITYRRTREQVASIVDATGASAIRSELRTALADFAGEVVLRISSFEEDEAYIRELVREAYLSDPETALDFPDADIAMYPNSGQRRIVEIILTYHQTRQTLESLRNSLLREAERIVGQLAGVTGDRRLDRLIQALESAGGYDPEGGSTAYAALLQGGGNSQGIALAFALLCRQAGIPCQVADGQRDGASHQWNVVQTQAGYRHLDLTRSGQPLYQTDAQAESAGYTWDRDLLPKCP